MRSSTERKFVDGPAGRIECAVDRPEGTARGAVLVAHPHPLYGGTLDNKVVQTLARSFVELGYEAWRPNFRGVGGSEGRHDEGKGEVEDLFAVYKELKAPVVLAGFSFGAAMQVRLSQKVQFERMVLVGLAAPNYNLPPVRADTLVIHGELDETIPLSAVLDWARPQELPVVVVPGADHFFHRKLQPLRTIVESNCK